MNVISIRLIVLISAVLLVACDSSSSGSSSASGTYVIDEYGTELVDVVVSGEPFPQSSEDADRPVIEEVEWLEDGEQLILRLTVRTDYPLLSLHLDFEGVHYILPTEAWWGDFADQSLCEMADTDCTQGCLDAGSCFQDCDVPGYTPGPPPFNLSDTEMIQQQFAISCTIQADGGSIGPGLDFETESHFLNEFWLGDNGDPAFDGFLADLGTCDTSDCPQTGIGEDRTETYDAVINPPPLEDDFSFLANLGQGALVAKSQPPNRDRGTLTSDGLTGATLDPCATGSLAIRNRC